MKVLATPIMISAIFACGVYETAASERDGIFKDFPGLPCTMINEVEGDDPQILSQWLHGFLSGVNWVNSEKATHILPDVKHIEEHAIAHCKENLNTMLTAEFLNSLYTE